jgi:DNA topoisomerase-1
MVEAQQARQILDRLVGFELSPVVWKKVPGGKSAGRVQSPAVRLLVEREREIGKFNSKFDFKVTGEFLKGRSKINAVLPINLPDEESATKLLESLSEATFTVDAVEKSPGKRTPPPPFTTSSLQQTANSVLGMSTRATMSAAQKLYQAGKITYMRTDSLNLSAQFIAAAGKYIESEFGAKYHKSRNFKTQSAGAQEAHEAIRPTNPSLVKAGTTPAEVKLYNLIRTRALATQMSEATLEKTTVKIDTSSACHSELVSESNENKDWIPGQARNDDGGKTIATFEAKGEVILFDGFLKVYGKAKDEILPALAVGDELKMKEIIARQNFAKPPARYTEGSLVKELEKRGIGRPSTYATIISTIQTRGYARRGMSDGVEREVIELKIPAETAVANTASVSRAVVTEKTGSDKGKLVPTDIGMAISDFLMDHFTSVVDYDFTAKVERELDESAESKIERNKMLEDFYGPFHKLIIASDGIDRSKVTRARKLGADPKTGEPVYARIARFGGVVQLGDGDDEKKIKPKFAPLPKGARVDTVTLDQALEALKLPRVVGTAKDGEEIIAAIGPFGPYLKAGKYNVSLGKDFDPHTITLAEAEELYEKKKASIIADWGDIKVIIGAYGPYIKGPGRRNNAKIPEGKDPKTITEDEAKKMLAEKPKTVRKTKPAPKKRRKTAKK